MHRDKITKYPVPEAIAENALINHQQYLDEYQRSVEDPDSYWREKGQDCRLDKALYAGEKHLFDPGHVSIKWFEDGTLNLSANCLDRHLAERGDKPAVIWEGDSPDESRTLTYRELHHDVCQFANVLKQQGSAKVMWLRFICRWYRKQWSPCWPVPVSVRCTR